MNQDSLDLNDFEGVTTLIVSTKECSRCFIAVLCHTLNMEIMLDDTETKLIWMKKIQN